MKVLLAVDGSACSEAAVDTVIAHFHPSNIEVRVIHAVEWLKDLPLSFEFGQGPTYAHQIVESRDRSFAEANRLVDRIRLRLKDEGFRTSVAMPDADPRQAVVDAAAEWPADMIVIGSHGRRGIDRLLLGSVAESVLRRSCCSVFVVRQPIDQRQSNAA